MAASALLASCNTLPRSGPDHGDVERKATVKYTAVNKKSGVDYALVDLTKQVAAKFDFTILNSLRNGFGGGKGPPPASPLGVGDVISITIFESQAGGLFIPDDAGSRPGNFITLPKQTIGTDGIINVPYAGDVRAAGRPVGDVQTEIQQKLANRAIEPQVVITTDVARSNSISVLGDVNAPAQLDLSPAGERVLDVIARAGGLKTPDYETYVTVTRRAKNATVLFRTLIDNPQENIYVRPGDTVFINRERRTYMAFGATGLSGRFDFQDSNLTLGEALGQAGGLLDSRADPSEVFLYREVEKESLAALGIDVSRFAGSAVPTIFRANLRDPAIFFATQKFKMKDKDIIYISNADSVELAKVLGLINGVSDTSANVPANALTTRNSIRRLGN
ncbi:polysaccharide biosynthesis/export family protein [Rhizobium sp.]